MKILFVISTLENCGPVNVLYALCAKLAHNQRISVLTISAEKNDSRWDDFSALPIELESLNLTRSQFMLYGCRRLKTFLTGKHFDVTHSHGIRADRLVSKLASSQNNTVKFSTAHNFPFEDYVSTYGKILGSLMANLQFRYWKKISNVITCSQYIGRQIKEKETSVHVTNVHNGTLQGQFICTKQLNSETINLIVLGSLNERKNSQFILECMQRVEPQLKRLKLTLVGNGPLFAELKKKYTSQQIIFKGHVKEPSSLLNDADWLLSASKSEGLPMAVLEALSWNCNLLLSDIGPHIEINEVVNNCDICRVFTLTQARDLEQLLLGIDQGIITWHEGGYELWQRNFSASVMAKKYLRTYQAKQN
ncbi:glycosyltransferase [Lactiplantibacillus daoliensis]|nr:glycosyltransferase [Lactiplantibacillus daoliensis]